MSILKLGRNRYRVEISLPRGLDGTRRRAYRTVNGTKEEAKRAERELLRQRDHGIEVNPERITLGSYLSRWLERHRAARPLADGTYWRYRQIIERRIVPSLGHIRLRDLRADHLADLYALQASTLSSNTIRQHHVVLSQALTEAMRTGLIHFNPAALVTRPSPGRRDEKRALSEQEIASLLAAAAGSRFDAVIRFALATGMREGELLGLRWLDVDPERSLVTVVRSAAYVPGEGMTFSSTKSQKSRRSIELSPGTVALLRRHRSEQAQRQLRLGPGWSEHDLVFPTRVGTPWFPRNFYRNYKLVVNRSGIAEPKTVDFHCLRHTAATQWIRAGADIHVVSRRLGHSDPAFTMRVYGHLLSGMQKTAAEALDHLLA